VDYGLPRGLRCFFGERQEPEAHQRYVQAFDAACRKGVVLRSCNEPLRSYIQADPEPPEEQRAVSTSSTASSSALVVTLNAEGPFPAGGPMKVTMTVENPTDGPLRFCRYHTPFEGIRNDIFSVSASIRDIEYSGMMAKRAPPGEDDYITLAPGESKSATVDLSDGYDIPPGSYALSYRGTDISGLPSSGPLAISVSK
jgi:hypothetical protein